MHLAAWCLSSTVGCVAEKPLDTEVACPCAPGWTCDSVAQLCVKEDVPIGGSGGTTVPDGQPTGPGCEPLVAPVNTSPGEAVAGCPCTRRPGPGNSYLCLAGANEATSQTIGPAGGTLRLIGQQGSKSEVPFLLTVPPGALKTAVKITVTETDLPPPVGFVDFSPIYHLQPDDLALQKIAALQIPQGTSGDTVPRELAVYRNPIANTCGFTKLGDSYLNAGFEQASLSHGGYLFVGIPKTEAQAMCP